MPISGLVVTFASPVAEHAATVESLHQIPEVEVGDSGGSKLAIVVDSEHRRRDQEIWNIVRDLPGMIDLAVALVAFDADGEGGTQESTRNQR